MSDASKTNFMSHFKIFAVISIAFLALAYFFVSHNNFFDNTNNSVVKETESSGDMSRKEMPLPKDTEVQPVPGEVPPGNLLGSTDMVLMSYTPMQCEENWLSYYSGSDEDERVLIEKYYKELYGIPLKVSSINYLGEAVCSACFVCPSGYVVEAEVSSQYVEKMKSLKWVPVQQNKSCPKIDVSVNSLLESCSGLVVQPVTLASCPEKPECTTVESLSRITPGRAMIFQDLRVCNNPWGSSRNPEQGLLSYLEERGISLSDVRIYKVFQNTDSPLCAFCDCLLDYKLLVLTPEAYSQEFLSLGFQLLN